MHNFYVQVFLFPTCAFAFVELLLHDLLRLSPSTTFFVAGPVALASMLSVSYLAFTRLTSVRELLLHATALTFAGLVLSLLTALLLGFSPILAVPIGLALFCAISAGFVSVSFAPIVRGRQRWTLRQARSAAAKLRQPDDPGVFWGGVQLPFKAVGTHFSIAGAPESGKTLLMRLFMQEQLPLVTKSNQRRALVYDPKGDALALLAHLSPNAQIRTLDPFDQRSYAWDLAADVTTVDQANEISKILVPKESETKDPFWIDSGQDLVEHVILAFIHHKAAWTLRDVVIATLSLNNMRAVLNTYPTGKNIVATYLDGDPKTAANIFATLNSKMKQYRTPAALMYYAHQEERTLALRDWLTQPSILILRRPKHPDSPLAALNRALFKRLSMLLLQQPEIDQANLKHATRVWIFFDELASAGELPGLYELLQLGRSKGVTAVVGFQTLEDIRSHYKPGMADALFGQIANRAVLRLESPTTAKWAQDIMGETEFSAKDAKAPYFVYKHPTVLFTEFMTLPPTNPRNGLHGFFKSAHLAGVWKARLTSRFLSQNLIPPDPNTPEFLPRPEDQERLLPWTEEDYKRLHLKPPEKASDYSIFDVSPDDFKDL
jgi:hypothetical protein